MSLNLPADVDTQLAFVPVIKEDVQSKLSGVRLFYRSVAKLKAAVVVERGNVTASLPVWIPGQAIEVAQEPGFRVWLQDLATPGNSHARTFVTLSGRTIDLASDDNVVRRTTGAPGSNGVTSGDMALDMVTGLLYTWSTVWDAGVQFLPPVASAGGGVSLVRQVTEVSNAALKTTLRSALDGIDQAGSMPVKRGARVLAIFDTAANVTQSGTGTATLTDDATDPYAGATGVRSLWADSSARWLTPVVDNQPFYASGIDLTKMNVEFTYKRLSTSTQALGSGLTLQLRSDASTPASPGANRLQLTFDTASGDPALNDDWHTLSVPIERFAVVGTGADITSIKMVTVSRGGQSGTCDVILGSVRAVPRQLRKAVVCFSFSDNRADTWNYAVQQMSRYGFPAVQMPGAVAGNLRNTLDAFQMSPRELRKLQQLHGWQIGSQAFTTETAGSLDAYTDEQFLAEFSGIFRLYRAMGVWGAVDGSYNPALPVTATKWTQLLRQLFRTMRVSYTHSAGQTPWPETSPIGDPMRLKSWSRNPTNNSGAQMIAYVQKAIDTQGMAVFSYHSLAANETVHAGETKTAFLTLMDWLHANRDKVDVVTIDTAIERMAGAVFNTYDGGPLPADTIAPAFASRAIANATPTVINVTMNEALSGALPASTAFTATVAGVARNVTAITSVDSTHFNITLESAATFGQAVTLTYTKPGANPLKDAVGNETAGQSAMAVTNNVDNPVAATPVRIGTLANITESGDGTAGYSYVHNGTGSGLNGTGISTLSFAADASGYIEWDNGDTGVGAHYLMLKTQSTPSGFATSAYAARAVHPTSGNYQISAGGAAAADTAPPLAGIAKDTCRWVLDRTAATATLVVKRFGESGWNVLDTRTGVPASRFYIGINLSQADLDPMVNIRGVGLT